MPKRPTTPKEGLGRAVGVRARGMLSLDSLSPPVQAKPGGAR